MARVAPPSARSMPQVTSLPRARTSVRSSSSSGSSLATRRGSPISLATARHAIAAHFMLLLVRQPRTPDPRHPATPPVTVLPGMLHRPIDLTAAFRSTSIVFACSAFWATEGRSADPRGGARELPHGDRPGHQQPRPPPRPAPAPARQGRTAAAEPCSCWGSVPSRSRCACWVSSHGGTRRAQAAAQASCGTAGTWPRPDGSDVQHRSVLVDGPAQVLPHPVDLDEHLVRMPLFAGRGTAGAQSVGVCLPELPTPPPDGLAGEITP